MGNNVRTKHKKTKRICKICGNEFLSTSAKICSKRCHSRLYRRKVLETGKYQFTCEHCGKQFRKDRLVRSDGKPYKYCSSSCSRLYVVDKRLKIPRIDERGYVLIGCRNHPNARQGRVSEHRLVIEGVLGRYLDKSEIVHHIDGDRRNNDPSNLMVTDHKNHSSCTSKHRERYKVSEAFIKSIGKWEDYLRYVSK